MAGKRDIKLDTVTHDIIIEDSDFSMVSEGDIGSGWYPDPLLRRRLDGERVPAIAHLLGVVSS